MTLDEIYRWITLNIPYFRNKGDEISSSGWKVLMHIQLEIQTLKLLTIAYEMTNSIFQIDVG